MLLSPYLVSFVKQQFLDIAGTPFYCLKKVFAVLDKENKCDYHYYSIAHSITQVWFYRTFCINFRLVKFGKALPA
jgi:hypothetical protein